MVQQPRHFYTTKICFVTESIKGKWCHTAKQLFCTPIKSYKSTSLTAGSDCKQAEGVLQEARAIKCYQLDFKTQGTTGSFKLWADDCNANSPAPHLPPFLWKKWPRLLFFAEKPAQAVINLCPSPSDDQTTLLGTIQSQTTKLLSSEEQATQLLST